MFLGVDPGRCSKIRCPRESSTRGPVDSAGGPGARGPGAHGPRARGPGAYFIIIIIIIMFFHHFYYSNNKLNLNDFRISQEIRPTLQSGL